MGVEEELTTVGVIYELDEVDFSADRAEEIVCIESKHASNVRKGHGAVGLELERMVELVLRCLWTQSTLGTNLKTKKR